MFGTRFETEVVAETRDSRVAALREALDLVGDAGVVLAGDLDQLFGSRPPSVALENGTWDFEAEQTLAADLRSVMDRLAGLVYRLEREQKAVVNGSADEGHAA